MVNTNCITPFYDNDHRDMVTIEEEVPDTIHTASLAQRIFADQKRNTDSQREVQMATSSCTVEESMPHRRSGNSLNTRVA